MPNWDEIQKEWETTRITFKDLAEKHGVKDSTIRSRKNREKWQRNDATQRTEKKKSVATKKQPKEPIVESGNLTDKQRLFCIYYIKSFNQTMAAIKAGYSPDRAHVTGSELVRNSKVAEEIRRLKGEMQQGIFIDAMDVLNKYIQIAFADITDYATFGKKEVPVIGMFGPVEDEEGNVVTEERNYVDFKESSMIDGTILTEVKQGKDGISVKLADKMKALEMLSKYFDLLSDNDKKRLQEEKLKAETMKIAAETKNDKGGEGKTIILTGEDEMRRILAEKARENHDSD
ncbi:terminase small subunit [Bacillus sp. FSL K6-3431]|uniref:terminase small subunit n=1 Tax=Bacillus sp. FSL K6-3431 TaxID=2921500 RepID=UPI0030FB1101